MNGFSDEIYNKRIDNLFLRFPSVQKTGFNEAYKPGLKHMEDFDALLDFPDRKFKSIHVAGTNGKGSVCNILASVLAGEGLKVGLYTSPHILDFRERLRIVDGRGTECKTYLVDKPYVMDFLDRWNDTFETLELSFFEITTGMAFQWFADQGVDVAVVEVGLGGRLDSTNVITPALSIITSIGLDHCQMLGDTLALVAGEKAGIIKKNVPVVIGEYLEQTRPVFIGKALAQSAPITFAQDVEPSLWDQAHEILENMDLQGVYQQANLRTVLCALDVLGDSLSALQTVKSIEKTAQRCDFHGRWERLSRDPFVICDIGHNAAALRYNFGQLDSMINNGQCSSLTIVYGVMADKDLDAIMPLMPTNANYIFTAPATSRALASDKIMERYRGYLTQHHCSTERLYKTESVREAVSMAISLSHDLSLRKLYPKAPLPLIYIGGSTFVVAEAIPLFK